MHWRYCCKLHQTIYICKFQCHMGTGASQISSNLTYCLIAHSGYQQRTLQSSTWLALVVSTCHMPATQRVFHKVCHKVNFKISMIVQEIPNSIANTLELRTFCTNPWIWSCMFMLCTPHGVASVGSIYELEVDLMSPPARLLDSGSGRLVCCGSQHVCDVHCCRELRDGVRMGQCL